MTTTRAVAVGRGKTFLHGNMRVVLLVGRYSDGIAAGPTWIQVRSVVHTDDKIVPRYCGQAAAHSSFHRNIVTFGREESMSTARVQGKDTCTRPCVGSASVKNWNVSKKLAPWNESEREYDPANACGTRRGKRRRKSAKRFMDVW
jgi:hypothetical protein